MGRDEGSPPEMGREGDIRSDMLQGIGGAGEEEDAFERHAEADRVGDTLQRVIPNEPPGRTPNPSGMGARSAVNASADAGADIGFEAEAAPPAPPQGQGAGEGDRGLAGTGGLAGGTVSPAEERVGPRIPAVAEATTVKPEAVKREQPAEAVKREQPAEAVKREQPAEAVKREQPAEAVKPGEMAQDRPERRRVQQEPERWAREERRQERFAYDLEEA